jgi:hypothetical protein
MQNMQNLRIKNQYAKYALPTLLMQAGKARAVTVASFTVTVKLLQLTWKRYDKHIPELLLAYITSE